MENVTFEEMSLMCIYNSAGTREGLIDALTEMRGYLGPDETGLLALTDSSIEKLTAMSDDDYAALDLYPDFDGEDAAYGV